MKRLSIILFFLYINLIIILSNVNFNYTVHKKRVLDDVNILSESFTSSLQSRLDDFAEKSQVEVFIVFTDALHNTHTLEQESLKVANLLTKNSYAVVFFVPVKERLIRIELTKMMEYYVTKSDSKNLIENYLVPHFGTGDFEGGLTAAINELTTLVDNKIILREPIKQLLQIEAALLLGFLLLRTDYWVCKKHHNSLARELPLTIAQQIFRYLAATCLIYIPAYVIAPLVMSQPVYLISINLGIWLGVMVLSKFAQASYLELINGPSPGQVTNSTLNNYRIVHVSTNTNHGNFQGGGFSGSF